MPTFSQSSIRLFRLAGVDVFLNWTWFLLVLYAVERGHGNQSSIVWSVLSLLALFLIVLTHEFGHSLACRQVGGTANRIMLWPFGGVAYVDPPQRPGAVLWSIVAGPLVNVVLIPILFGAITFAKISGWEQSMPDAYSFLLMVAWINKRLLYFNILPIYPLDGGKILWALLWLVMGRARSLMVATVLGLLGLACFVLWALLSREVWLILISVYLVMNCWGGLQRARALLKIERQPRRQGFACPSCRTAPPLGAKWRCGQCQQGFDMFETRAVCPNCSAQYPLTMCGYCGKQSPMSEWVVGAAPGVGVLNGRVAVK